VDILQDRYDDIIALALGMEREKIELYTDMAGKCPDGHRQDLFQRLADMERGHKERLETMDRAYFASRDVRMPLEITSRVPAPAGVLDPQSGCREILLYALKREQEAFELYRDLAALYPNIPEIRKIFEVLAEEEAEHHGSLERELRKHHGKEEGPSRRDP